MFDVILVSVMEVLMVLTSILGFVSLIGLFVIAQRYLFIKKTKRKYLVLVASFLVSLLLCVIFIPNSGQGYSQSRGIMNLDVGEDESIGYLQVVNDKDDILAFGKFITGEGQKVKYYDVELKNDVADIKGLSDNYDKKLTEEINKEIYNFKNCEKKTVSYKQMEKISQSGVKHFSYNPDLGFTLINIVIFYLPFILTLKDYFTLKKRQKIQRETIESKIKDI